MENKQKIKAIRNGMLLQDKRGTSYPIFIVVENKKIYGVDNNVHGRERYSEVEEETLCDDCKLLYNDNKTIPEDCETCDDELFINYRIEEDVPNLRAGFFFTAQACNEHIQRNRHHYGRDAHSYAISAYHNEELKAVMVELIGEVNQHKLR